MLPRDPVAALVTTGALAAALWQCGVASDPEPTATVRQAILAGQVVSDAGSPVLFLVGPEGQCTATLVAPTLAVTARHCVAQLTEGAYTCTPGGMLDTGGGAGSIGADNAPDDIHFFANARVIANTAFTGAPDAVGAAIISTESTSVCSDDLAFVVLDQSIAGTTPAAVRIDTPTYADEPVSAWGYGLTDVAQAPLALRIRDDAEIVGVGPDTPAATTQIAPLRAVRVGPGDVTCNGDSGGPITSNATGAIVAVVSIGEQANADTPNCTNTGVAETTGPLLSDYAALALQAFAAAGAAPILEGAADAAAPDPDSMPASDARPEGGEGQPPGAPLYDAALGGGCSVAANRRGGESERDGGGILVALATAALAAGRRRRWSR